MRCSDFDLFSENSKLSNLPYEQRFGRAAPSRSFAAASEQGFIMVRSSVLDNESGSLPLFAHEAAHGWWGNLVRSDDPGGKMASEALAQYGAVVSIESIEGRDAMVEFLRFSRHGYNPLQCALGYFFMWSDGGDKPRMELARGKWDHNLADSKGMWFYHMRASVLRSRTQGHFPFYCKLREGHSVAHSHRETSQPHAVSCINPTGHERVFHL